MATELTVESFGEYFEALHGVTPFPWQTKLAKRVVGDGWPALLDLPTGSGKTAAIDVAVFALALCARRDTPRTVPLRTFFVVDRRIIVDEAYDRAVRIAERIRTAEDGVLRAVRDALLSFHRDMDVTGPLTSRRPPLQVVRLRGGIPRDTDWAETPTQPLIVVSTVDQVGSRLLFRGYGVTPRMWPVHAGLVGSDALWLLDEVHLARPLDETLAAIARGHEPDGLLAQRPRLAPFHVARLSATPGIRPPDRFTLADADWADPRLGPRLRATKWAELRPFAGDVAPEMVKAVDDVVSVNPVVQRVGVIANTIATARDVFERLRRRDDIDVTLMIGRVRDLDRDAIAAEISDLKSGQNRPQLVRHKVLVATQTIEAGADIDLDVLVTEIAAIDALRQRFGRLNRLGRPIEAGATIFFPEASNKASWKTIERIYGSSADRTRRWLSDVATKKRVDFGIASMDRALVGVTPDEIEAMIAERLHAPTLLPPYAASWAMTAAAPSAVTPAPDLFLHGRRTVNDVSIVWRADITYDGTIDSASDLSIIREALRAAPPSSLEVLELPIYHAKRLSARQPRSSNTEETPLVDLPLSDEADTKKTAVAGWCIRYEAGDETAEWIKIENMRVGDVIVIPADRGGYDRYGWLPSSSVPVTDIGDTANLRQRRRRVVRFHPRLLQQALAHERGNPDRDDRASWRLIEADSRTVWSQIEIKLEGTSDDPQDAIAAVLRIGDIPPGIRTDLQALAADPPSKVKMVVYSGDDNFSLGFAITSRAVVVRSECDKPTGQASVTAYDLSWRTGVAVLLSDHSRHVCDNVSEFATRLNIEPAIAEALIMAAYFHDVGKADVRFQADLRGEAALFALGLSQDRQAEDLLAKSGGGILRGGPRATPRGFRHEALSVALVQHHPRFAALSATQRDLALWLIGTHHGYGRPFFPAYDTSGNETSLQFDNVALSVSDESMPLRLDGGWFELEERVRRLYGPWEIARLEAVLRLADHRASEDEAEDRYEREEHHASA